MDLGQMLAQTAAQNPEKTAIIFHDQRTSYREFDERANQVANGLIQFGVEPGDRVALYIHNLPIFMEAYFGILKAGASVVPLNVLYKAGEVEYILKDSGAKAILTFVPFAPVALAAAQNASELRHVIVAAPEPMPGATLWRDAFGDALQTRPRSPCRMRMSPSSATPLARLAIPRARCSPIATSTRTWNSAAPSRLSRRGQMMSSGWRCRSSISTP